MYCAHHEQYLLKSKPWNENNLQAITQKSFHSPLLKENKNNTIREA